MPVELLIADWHTGTLLGTVPYTDLSWKEIINDAGEWSATVSAAEPVVDDLLTGRTLIYVHDPASRSILYAGILWTMMRRPASDLVEISGSGLYGYLERRIIRAQFIRTTTDQLAIAAALVADAQAVAGGSLRLNVVRQPTNSAITRDVKYPSADLPVYGNIIANLAGMDKGFEFRCYAAWTAGGAITHTILFAYPRLGRDLPFVWTDGVDVVVDSAEDNRTDYATWWRARGTGTGGSSSTAPTIDSGSATQPVALRGFPVLDGGQTYSDIDSVPMLFALGTAELASSWVENLTVKLADNTAYPLGSWQLGDSLRIVSDPPSPPGLDGNSWWRIGGYTTAIDDVGHREISLDVDRTRIPGRPYLSPLDRRTAELQAIRWRQRLNENRKNAAS